MNLELLHAWFGYLAMAYYQSTCLEGPNYNNASLNVTWFTESETPTIYIACHLSEVCPSSILCYLVHDSGNYFVYPRAAQPSDFGEFTFHTISKRRPRVGKQLPILSIFKPLKI